MLLHDTTPLHKAAAEILRTWREYVPIEPLFLAMQDANVQVRSAAKWALADVGEYAQQESLLPHLADADTEVHVAVLYTLGTHAPVTSVLEAVWASEESLREAAASLVGLLWMTLNQRVFVKLHAVRSKTLCHTPRIYIGMVSSLAAQTQMELAPIGEPRLGALTWTHTAASPDQENGAKCCW